MVRNKHIGGRLNRSSTGKNQKAGSQISSSKDLTPPDKPAEGDIPANSPELQTISEGQLGFPDRVYLLASFIFQNHHLEKPPAQRLVSYGKGRALSLPRVKDEEMQRTAYELAFNTLKYQELLEDIMIDSCFYLTQPMPDDQMCLVAVMLYDFQDRKFLPRERQRDGEIEQEVRDVEKYLLRFKTKLAASLARCRIKHDLLSIECILPESLKTKQERSSSLPLYAWVNTLESSLDEVQSVLKSAGFSQVKSIGQLEGETFCQDPHCGDILVFPAQLKAQLYTTKLLSNHKLIIQDKSCSLGPQAVCSLLPEEGDVLMLGCFSGLTVSHTACLVAEKRKGVGSNQPTVYVCVSDRTDAQREELQQAVTAMGCRNVKLIPEVFQSLDNDDKRLQKVRVILLNPKCSVSAVSNPVDFILQENGDTELLQDLSQGSIAPSRLQALVAQQRKDIDHALKFPRVLSVVYSTCSSYQEENEEVVSRALEHAKARSEQEGEPKQANFRLSPSPFSIPDDAAGPEETEPFFMLEPSEQSNGCFLAVLSKEPEPVVKEAPRDVLVRANAKGILERIGTKKEHHGHTNRMKKTSHVPNSQPQFSAVKNGETKGSNSTSLCGQEFTNRRPSLQGKAKAMRVQVSKNTGSSSFSSTKPGNITPKRSLSPILDIPTSSPRTHSASPPAPPPPTPAVRTRRPPQEPLKPMVLVLPTIHFPSFFPAHPNYNKWRDPAQSVPLSRSSGGLSKDAMVKSRPLF
ncbi:putative methyltransferase NSUN7 [Gymnodraco acuticeps]|uniref:Methyltransferase NSUN7 n=1 Tax=Gymnodraco acuticeps TaxID=8218 RepID=A0A6P8V903_GYMAC|nr:putative methyltransferase NSUN7 [Gymnodraco acuticeps]